MVQEIVGFGDIVEHIGHLFFFGALLFGIRNYGFAHWGKDRDLVGEVILVVLAVVVTIVGLVGNVEKWNKRLKVFSQLSDLR